MKEGEGINEKHTHNPEAQTEVQWGQRERQWGSSGGQRVDKWGRRRLCLGDRYTRQCAGGDLLVCTLETCMVL